LLAWTQFSPLIWADDPDLDHPTVSAWSNDGSVWHSGAPPGNSGNSGSAYAQRPGPSQQQIQQNAAADAANASGLQSINNGDWDAAIQSFEKALSYRPGDQTIQQNLQSARQRKQQAADAAAQMAFQADKARALQELKGIGSDDDALKSAGDGGPASELKGVDDSDTGSRPQLKGVDDDSGLQLKDAVSDGGEQEAFKDNRATKDLFSGRLTGFKALDGALGISDSDVTNPSMRTALENTAAYLRTPFDSRGPYDGEIEPVVLSGATSEVEQDIANAPESLKKDPNFVKLVRAHTALQHEGREIQRKIDEIRQDPSWVTDAKKSKDLDQLQTAQNRIAGMGKIVDDHIETSVRYGAVDLSDDSGPSQKGLDSDGVPSP
jgi:hypothetical protein